VWMDGRSVASQLLATAAVPEAEAEVLEPLDVRGRPPNAAYFEYHGLGPVGEPGRLLDSFNNTFRGVRLVGGAGAGRFERSRNLLFAEWGSDFLFSSVVFREVYDMDEDPWQMTNLYGSWSRSHKLLLAQLANLTRRMYTCSWRVGPARSCRGDSANARTEAAGADLKGICRPAATGRSC